MFRAYNRPRYQVSVYRTISPLVNYVITLLHIKQTIDRTEYQYLVLNP